jgi:hypothetical protein
LKQRQQHKTPIRISAKGKQHGGRPFSRGHLYQILSNPVYIGKIRHKDNIYDGLHEGLITEATFEQVQRRLKTQAPEIKNKTIPSGKILQGLLYDCDGTIYSPTYTVKKGVRYCYYLNQSLIQYRDHPKSIMARIPAHEIEKTVTEAIKSWMINAEELQVAFPDMTDEQAYWLTANPPTIDSQFITATIKNIIVQTAVTDIHIDAEKLRQELETHSQITLNKAAAQTITIHQSFKTGRAKRGALIISSNTRTENDPFDIPADQLRRIVRGTIWRDEHFAGAAIKQIANDGNHSENYVNRCIHESLDFISQ